MKQVTFRVDIKPVGTNQAYRKRGQGFGMYMTKEGASYKEIIAAEAWNAMTEQCHGHDFIKSPEVSLAFFYGDQRKHDIDSAIKLTLDSMNGVVWNDDSEIGRLLVTKGYRKGRPAVVIHVTGQ